ncbi:MAG TPA: EAL domain-containing protein [bacterium]|nr:EAL domain-containing protein [bacterium]
MDINIFGKMLFMSGILSFTGMFRFRLSELMPAARCAIRENMCDGFLLIDSRGKIADANNTLLKILSQERKNLLGQFFEEALVNFPSIVDVCRQETADTRVSLNNRMFFNVRVMPLKNLNSRYLGKLVLFQDVTEKTVIEKNLQRNEKLRSLLSNLATNFINIPVENMEAAINESLSRIGEFTGLDRVYIFSYDCQKRLASNTYEWCAKGINPCIEKLQNIPFDTVPELLLPHLEGKIIHIPDTRRLPSGSNSRALMEDQQIKTLVTLPMMLGGECSGFVGLDAVREKRELTEEEINLLKILAEIFTNAEKRRKDVLELKESKNRYSLFFENSPLGIVHLDGNGRIIKVNSKFISIIGAPEEKIVGMNTLQDIKDLQMKKCIRNALKGITSSYEGNYTSVITGKSTYIRGTAKSITDGGIIIGVMGIFEDITDSKQIEEKLRYDALHDSLTNLANRTLLLDRIERAILHNRRKPSDRFILMFLDLDDFKKVNDSLGHSEGDKLLRDVAKKLAGCLRPDDTLARLGGDEFAILLEFLPEFEMGTQIAKRILSAMREPMELSGHMISITASMGICYSSEEISGPNEYLRNADMAMYKAKNEGKNRFAYFSPSMHETVIRKLTEETYLWETVRNKKLSVYYQPLVELQSETTVGYEALLRWIHPEKGLLMPGAFIPLAEETGLIVLIGEWVMEEACRQKWLQRGKKEKPLNLHINISARQLYSRDIILKVRDVIKTTGFPSESLCLEITESILMLQSMADIIVELKGMGVKLIIDDFGTGFSSLSYLHRYPVDGIKIDHSFVSGMLQSRKDAEIVKTIIAMGKTLQMSVTAEGVETKEQADYLKQLGCGFGQGFLWGRPVEKGNLLKA